MLEVTGQDIISGNMGFIGTDPGREYQMGAAEKTEDVTVTGNPAVLDNATGKSFKDLHIYGRSEQTTTTGAQLFDPISNKLNLDGITITFDENGEKIVVSGTPKSSRGIQISKPIRMQAGEKYVLTLDETHCFENTWLQSSNGVQFGWLGKNSNNRVIITVPDSIVEKTDCAIHASVLIGEAYNFTINHLMLNTGSTALPWEPYTGGKPSPSPDYPQEIVSAGDDGNLSVIVKNPDNEQMQSVSFSTPNGLPGIPVTSGGNYTDENGKQWICDEVDLGRGVYVQRVDKGAFDATKALTEQSVILATPIETPLTAAEISAYKSLRTYKGTTIVEAEDKAGISVTYKRNAKTDNVSAEKKIEESEKKEYDES